MLKKRPCAFAQGRFLSGSVQEISFEKVLVSQFFCRQAKETAAVGAHNILAVGAASAYVLQIAAASDGLHEGEKQ